MSTMPLFDRDRSGGDDDDSNSPREKVYRVSQLNRAVRGLLEDRFAQVWVEGELSDVTHAASGHVYFTLNDELEPAQLRVVMFKNDARRSKAKLEDGARVKLQGQLSLFTPRGSYQLIARIAMPFGLGELHAQFERLRKKLEAEGLLAPERKRALPKLPRVLGVVTSQHGAALHDILRVAHARCPLRVVVSPCLVQGNDAPRSIVRALEQVQRLRELDVVIIGRGGGASEDLLAFNDERVARAIAACRVPIVSAVGHEVDISIADLIADVRAATPSNAAELVVPERRVLASELRNAERAVARAIDVRIGRERLRLERLHRRIEDPSEVLRAARASLANMHDVLVERLTARARQGQRELRVLHERLQRTDPRLRLAERRARLVRSRTQLASLGRPLLFRRRARLSELAARLSALSPLAILGRGYAIALHEKTGKALLRAEDAAHGDVLQVRLHEGTLRARVERK
ncbi:MAG TPA: exodeoxyribonuclease VII large subunit [Polyangiales bacterium]|jgi:exodeoxyribonuclease VII large subunit|nr:exodeoxyribonuclease VII large subunit [Polyangiales bacterium]